MRGILLCNLHHNSLTFVTHQSSFYFGVIQYTYNTSLWCEFWLVTQSLPTMTSPVVLLCIDLLLVMFLFVTWFILKKWIRKSNSFGIEPQAKRGEIKLELERGTFDQKWVQRRDLKHLIQTVHQFDAFLALTNHFLESTTKEIFLSRPTHGNGFSCEFARNSQGTTMKTDRVNCNLAWFKGGTRIFFTLPVHKIIARCIQQVWNDHSDAEMNWGD